MAKLRCVCGYVISLSGEIPNPVQWQCISDCVFDEITGMVDASEIYLRAKMMFKCPQSGHLWIFWDGIDAPPSLYAPNEYGDWVDN